ncbi:MAG TPA: isoprenylcysteine carboxylmethyltransferase family protein [Anaerolineales bacterium]
MNRSVFDRTELNTTKPALDRSGVARIFQVLLTIVLIGVLLFVSAGRLDWTEAWIYLVLYSLSISVNAFWALRHDPELVNERGRPKGKAKSWDAALIPVYAVAYLAVFVVAGLDAVRYGWSTVPLAVKVLGAVGICLGMALIAWVMRVNSYLSTVVRIQSDRGQQVVSSGPYHFVRHPMYLGMIISTLCLPFFLGAWWALVPAISSNATFVVRTALEDRTLQQELPGYVEYTGRVRYRLLPGVW